MDDSSIDDSSTAFIPPSTAAELAEVFATQYSNANDFDIWVCAMEGDSPIVAYHLGADQNGVEYDLRNQNAETAFTWTAMSGGSLTTVADTGLETVVDNITFSSRNNVSFTVNQLLTFSCQRETNALLTEPNPVTPPVNANDNSVNYGGQEYQLTHGLEEQFRFRTVQGNDTHRSSQINIANGEFFSTILLSPSAVIWRPRAATVWLRASIHTPGPGDFTSATFTYEPDSTDEDGPTVAGRNFFQDGSFGIDINNDGAIESADGESLDITGGRINISKSGEIYSVSFDISLENGVDVSGAFSGDFLTVSAR